MTAPIRISPVRVPKPRALNMISRFSPAESSNVVNLASSVGPESGVSGPDYYYELLNRIQGDITTRRKASNVDVNAMMKSITPLSQWKPNVRLPASQYRPGTAPTGGGAKLSGSGVDSWISQAYRILGIRLTPDALKKERFLVMKESGGNPRAVNRWDSNWRKGTPSIGLAQTIQSTFNGYRLAGYNDIYNPVHNLIASLRYRRSRYGNYDIGYYKGGY